MERKNFLQFPKATEGIHLEDAYRHRLIISTLDDMFFRWGYLPVETPAFDFFDIYRPLLHGKDLERVYRLIDREGDLLMLRSDITLFLAKQVGIALREEDLPVRACYSGVVLRHQNEEDISNNEFFQVGAECIGKPGKDGDLEILLLVLKTLSILDIPGRIHIGSREFFNTVTSGFERRKRAELGKAVCSRDRAMIHEILMTERKKPAADILTELFLFIGTGIEFTTLLETKRTDFLAEEEHVELQYLASLMDVLISVEATSSVRIDLSEIGSQPYYTGIVFQGYMETLDSAFLSGGRYDELLSRFGLSAVSVGFSFFLRKIEPFIGRSERFAIAEEIVKAEGDGILEKYKNAEKLRRDGKRVVL